MLNMFANCLQTVCTCAAELLLPREDRSQSDLSSGTLPLSLPCQVWWSPCCRDPRAKGSYMILPLTSTTVFTKILTDSYRLVFKRFCHSAAHHLHHAFADSKLSRSNAAHKSQRAPQQNYSGRWKMKQGHSHVWRLRITALKSKKMKNW